MSTEVKTYSINVNGGPNGYANTRAQIQLQGEGSSVIGWLRFHDPGMAFPEDEKDKDRIIMHLPTSMFQNVLDILRNSKQVMFRFGPRGGCTLEIGSGSVGAGETK